MKFKIDFSRPDLIFSLVWLSTLLLSYSFKTIFTAPFNDKVTLMIGTNILSSILIFQLFNYRLYENSTKEITLLNIETFNKLKKWTYFLVGIWFIGFVINVFFSKGFPLYWRFTGDSRTYTEFGVPSFSGLLNALRLFTSVSLIVLLLNKFGFKELFLLCILLISSLLELSRGNFTFLLLTVLGAFLLFRKFDLKMIVLCILGLIGFLYFFGYIGNIRGSSSNVQAIVIDNSIYKKLPDIFIWGIAYITSPLNNLNYAAEWINPSFWPKYSIMGLVPTVIRESILGPVNYPIHIADSTLNATTFYSPLVADFGFSFSCLIVIFLQIGITAIYFEAKQGRIFSLLAYPILVSSLFLSVFYMYLFTLLVVFYICLSWIISKIQAVPDIEEV